MFKNPFSFNGRIRRTEFGYSMLIYWVISLAISLFVETDVSNALIAFILYIPLLWFLLAQGTKRCHDRDHSGFYQLIPFYGFWMLFSDGIMGTNDYGSDPRGREGVNDFVDSYQQNQ